MRYVEMGLVNELDEDTRKLRNWTVPNWLIFLAKQHQMMGLNYS